MDRLLRKSIRFFRKNYFLALFFLAGLFVVSLVGYKLFIAKPTYMYAKVKVGQGLWWASTQRPSMWFVEAIQQAKEDRDLTGKPLAKVLSATYYPYYGSGQDDVYVVVRLKVSKIGSEGKYSFDRSTIGVGSPIELELRTVQFSGTIVQLSQQPITNNYVEKTVVLEKKNAVPWEFDAITVGDVYNNGETNTLQVLDKQSSDTYALTTNGNYSPSDSELRKNITVKVKLKGYIINNQFVYAEDQTVVPGRNISLSTPNFVFTDYMVAKVE